MARIARVAVPDWPHHVTQRGNRRMQTFFGEADYRAYLSLVSEWCSRHGVAIWAYCLMPNHVHLIAVPAAAEGLARALGEAHRRYTRQVNFREKWRGYLWQGRFGSVAMDEPHLLAAARYVETNPVRARLVASAEDWPWSSAAAHVSGKEFRGHNTYLLTNCGACGRGLGYGEDCTSGGAGAAASREPARRPANADILWGGRLPGVPVFGQ